MLNIEDFADSSELFDGRYALIRPLSVDGATADVWLALDTNTVAEEIQWSEVARLSDDEIEKLGLIVAIKIYRPQNALDIEGEQRFREEYIIVFNCHHTNLIHPTHFSIFKETPYLVLPYCKLGSSELLIGNMTGDDNIWKYIKDVSSGLAYLHALTPPIVHQDIKPANVLLDDTHHYAITDFGISSQKGGVHGYCSDEGNSGTLAYMAPERFEEAAEPLPQSDIWAFGATLYEILTGKVPFGEEGGKKQKETNGVIPAIPSVSSDIQRLIHACLAKDPAKRPTAEEIMESAEARQYPIKSKKIVYGALAFLFVALVVCASYFLINSKSKQPTQEQLYIVALSKLNSENADSMKDGLNMMERLNSMNYVPAIYQLAFTYGWYSDSISVKRKRILGIAMDKEFMPVSERYSNKAVDLFSKIGELNDSAYADINANAAYRLACYYVMPNKIYKPNYDKGILLLIRSREWAKLAGNEILLEKIKNGLASFPQNYKDTHDESIDEDETPSPTYKENIVLPTPKKGILHLDYGDWEGNILDGEPQGVGKMTYTKAHPIGNGETTQPGDVIEGNQRNGHWVDVPTWHKASGETKKVYNL